MAFDLSQFRDQNKDVVDSHAFPASSTSSHIGPHDP
jgi:hypothetical protein